MGRAPHLENRKMRGTRRSRVCRCYTTSLTLPADFAEHFADATILVQHLAYRQHRFLSGELPLGHSVVQNDIYSCAQVQAMVCGYVDELVAVATNDRGTLPSSGPKT